jgi:hypothetical protein
MERSEPRALGKCAVTGLPQAAAAMWGKGDDRMTRSRSITTAILTLAIVGAMSVAWADAPPGPYFNGFETNKAGWFNFQGATVNRVQSGSSSAYANGVPASSGNWYARLSQAPNFDTCESGSGTQRVYYGPYTNWGGYSPIFPPGGYATGVDIYLDVDYAIAHPDTRFDWSSAISNTSGGFGRDFVFNVGTDPLGFVISGGNNATRCGANPADPGHAPVHVTESGWYEFRHTFMGVSGSPLIVRLDLIQKSTNAVIGTWIRTNPSDIIDVTVGGNRYGWFVQNEFDGLAIDNSYRTGATSTPNCAIKITNGGTIHADNLDKATFGGNARSDGQGVTSGQETYQDHGPLTPFTLKSTEVAAIICESDGTARILGAATVDGTGSHVFEIRVKDNGEPGSNDTYRIRVPDMGYDSGQHTLEGGNIQVTTTT